MDGLESMFDMDRDGELNNAERALEYEFLTRAEAGDGDVDWDKDPFESDGFDGDGFGGGDDW